MNAQFLIELQNGIVAAVASGIKGDWTAAVINIEIDVVDGEQTENCLSLSFKESGGVWKRNSFELPFECYEMFVTLRNGTDGWKSCTLEFDATGNYRFAFSHDSPKRLNGTHDKDSLLKDYVPPNLQEGISEI